MTSGRPTLLEECILIMAHYEGIVTVSQVEHLLEMLERYPPKVTK